MKINSLNPFWGAILILIGVHGLKAETVHVSTPATSLVLDAEKGEPLKFMYYGSKVESSDLENMLCGGSVYADAYQAYGIHPEHKTSLGVVHSDGNMTSRLVVRDVMSENNNGMVKTVVRTSDDLYPVDVDVCYLTYPGCDVIETWTEIINRERGDIRLTRFDSTTLPIRKGNVWLTHFAGDWASESQMIEEPLASGLKRIENTDGTRNGHYTRAEVMLSLDGHPDERHGATIGAALCYSGNYAIDIDTPVGDCHYYRAGINPDNSEYRLKKGEKFVTPPVALTFSNDGKGGVSRNFHRWGRDHMLPHGSTPRKILLNSWEGVYFDIEEPVMVSMMKGISDLGGELFVMDDGWFGGKYQRNDDTRALGDWVTDTRKLPNGLKALADSAKSVGVGFGLWIEPEMADLTSEIYEKHPDWIVKARNREPVTGRGNAQVVLDFSNPAVREYAIGVVDKILSDNPGIEYIKWDSNCGVHLHGSQYLDNSRQSHLYIDWHKGFEEVMNRLRALHPEIVIQACGGGGGRVNWGVMKYFDEFWTSDNTDPLQRIYTQWGTSYFYPAMAMAAHISASPNHQTHRKTPIKFRADVAMSGRLGLELQPSEMSEEERNVCRQAIADYKSVRNTIQLGDLYRLKSPYDRQGVASLMYVSPDKNDAVFFWYRTESFAGQRLPVVKMDGLDRKRMYKVSELNRIDNSPLPFEGKCFSGDYLMNNGLVFPYPYTHNVDHDSLSDFSSRVLHLEAL